MAMYKLILRSIMWGADKIPDSWFDRFPGDYYKARAVEQLNDVRNHRWGHNDGNRQRHSPSDDENDDEDGDDGSNIDHPYHSDDSNGPNSRRDELSGRGRPPQARHRSYDGVDGPHDRGSRRDRTRSSFYNETRPQAARHRSHSIRNSQKWPNMEERLGFNEEWQDRHRVDVSTRDSNGWSFHHHPSARADKDSKNRLHDTSRSAPNVVEHDYVPYSYLYGTSASDYRPSMAAHKSSFVPPLQPPETQRPSYPEHLLPHKNDTRRPSQAPGIVSPRSQERSSNEYRHQHTNHSRGPRDEKERGRSAQSRHSRKYRSESSQEHRYDSGFNDFAPRSKPKDRKKYSRTRSSGGSDPQSVRLPYGQHRARGDSYGEPRTTFRER